MIVSPFTPLDFSAHRSDGLACEYMQTFATADEILIQLIGPEAWPGVGQVFSEPDHSVLYQIVWNVWKISADITLRFAVIKLNPGMYSVSISGIGQSKTFCVTDNERILSKTTLIQYSMHNNRQRNDAVFFIDGMQYYFDFRVPGGFKDSNWTFGVESEQFVTDKSDIMQLYALESVQQKFTLGTSRGCSVWFAEMLNRLLCCTYVYFDGVRYTRKDTSVPEMTQTLEGVNSFVFTQNLQQVKNLDPTIEQRNHLILRRATATEYRNASTNIRSL